MQYNILLWRDFYLMLCLNQQMSEEPTEDDVDEEEFIESSMSGTSRICNKHTLIS